ncbi:MAG: class I SAM-dependent methyltransferase [Alphaproteobacteria bacterium]|nr:class I SAM-dependent methyltransferase [Alphaproteobacteria bacterium]
MLIEHLLRDVVRKGSLHVVDSNGRTHRYGPDDGSTPVVMRVRDRWTELRLLLNPLVNAGEAYMDGGIEILQGSLREWMALCYENFELASQRRQSLRVRNAVGRAFRFVTQHNPVGLARKHVAHHYDLSGELFDLILDTDRQYSCAYFPTPGTSLEQAQDAKKRHIAAKLLLKPGMRVLDIGSGWGGLALYLARAAQVHVTGVTLSIEQQQAATARAKAAGLSDRVQFHLRDYREESGQFDRIVSVGMFEHVGVKHFSEFFAKLRGLLAEDGIALLHAIGRFDGPGATNPWLRKYIFPGGYAPALSEVTAAIERSRLLLTDVEILRLHYAETIKEWSRRFARHRDRVKSMYDERFCRMWEFYLAGCEMSFRHGGQMVFQIQIARSLGAVPLTRDYIGSWEHVYAQAAE